MITHILRFGEVDELSGNRILMLLDELSYFTVGVVVDRTASVVSKVGILLRHTYHVSQTRQYETRLIGGDACFQFDRTVFVDCPYLVGSKLEVTAAELLVCQFLNLVLARACSTQNLGCIRSLRLYCE